MMNNKHSAFRKISNVPPLNWFEDIGYGGMQYYDAESDEVWCILYDLNTTRLYGVVADASTGRHIIEVDDSGTNGSQRAVYEKLVDAYGRIASSRHAAWDWHPNDGYSGCDTHYEGDIAYVICPPDFSDDGWGVQVFDEADEDALDYGETMWEEYGFTSEQQAKEFAELSEFGSRRAWYDDPRRVEYDDDLIAVYGPNGELWYKGIYDYAGVDDGCYRFDEQTGRYVCDIDGSWYEKIGMKRVAMPRHVAQERTVDSETWWQWFEDARDDIDGLVGHYFGKPVEIFADVDNYGTNEARVDVKVSASTNSMSEMDLEDLREVLHAAVRAIDYAKDLSGWTIID